MSRSRRRTASAAVLSLLALLIASFVFAGAQARIIGKVLGPDKKPVAGAKVIITNPKVPSFKIELTTDDKGEFKTLISDSTYSYLYTITTEGFPPLAQEKKAPIGDTTEFEFQLGVAAQASAGGKSAPPAAEVPKSEKAKMVFNDGVALLNANDAPGAEKKFLESTELDPDLATAWKALAKVAVDRNDGVKALEYSKKALDAKEKADAALKAMGEEVDESLLPGFLMAYAQAQEMTGDKPGAKATRTRLAKATGDASGPYNEGVELFNKNKLKEAREKFEKAVELNDEFAPAHKMLGLIFMNAQKNAEAKKHFQRCVETDKTGKDAEECKAYLGYL